MAHYHTATHETDTPVLSYEQDGPVIDGMISGIAADFGGAGGAMTALVPTEGGFSSRFGTLGLAGAPEDSDGHNAFSALPGSEGTVVDAGADITPTITLTRPGAVIIVYCTDTGLGTVAGGECNRALLMPASWTTGTEATPLQEFVNPDPTAVAFSFPVDPGITEFKLSLIRANGPASRSGMVIISFPV